MHQKIVWFHIFAHGCAKNTPDFTLPNRDTPKTHPVLDANLQRRTFQGVCNTPLHVYVQNPPGFIFPHTDTPKTRRVLYPNHRRRTFRGVCFCALHGYAQTPPSFTPKPSARIIFEAYAFAPYTGTCKIWRVSYFRTHTRQKRTRFYPSQ